MNMRKACVNGINLAFDVRGSGPPLVLIMGYRLNSRAWPFEFIEGIAKQRTVILFDNRGIGRSSGLTPDNVASMAADAMAFIEALEIARVDVLGFCLGSMVALQMLFDSPARIRRAILVGAGGPGAAGMLRPEVAMVAARARMDADGLLFLLFQPTNASQAAGGRYVERMRRQADGEPAITPHAIEAHLAAIRAWGAANGEAFARLKQIEQPVLIVNGTRDIMVPSFNAFALAQQIPNAQLILYPDAGHGSLFQYPDWFVHDALRFLGRA